MNADQLIILIISAILNGAMLAVGMIIGTKWTARSLRKEAEQMLEESETAQAIKKLITDQTLIEKATKFFEEATTLVSSPDAKNFFKNAAELLKEFSGAPEVKVNLPEKKKSLTKTSSRVEGGH